MFLSLTRLKLNPSLLGCDLASRLRLCVSWGLLQWQLVAWYCLLLGFTDADALARGSGGEDGMGGREILSVGLRCEGRYRVLEKWSAKMSTFLEVI